MNHNVFFLVANPFPANRLRLRIVLTRGSLVSCALSAAPQLRVLRSSQRLSDSVLLIVTFSLLVHSLKYERPNHIPSLRPPFVPPYYPAHRRVCLPANPPKFTPKCSIFENSKLSPYALPAVCASLCSHVCSSLSAQRYCI